SWTDYHVAYRAGFRHPLDRGAAGRAILKARQGHIEDAGLALQHSELEGASGAAAPLLGVNGIEGSVGVVMLADTVPERVGPRVVEAAREVSEALR
ncbi:IclR family transcriptional regulator, partial [Streptomyces rimosus subsp. pseudoverticillatus]